MFISANANNFFFFLKNKFHLLTLANASEITNDNNELLYHMGRAETSLEGQVLKV